MQSVQDRSDGMNSKQNKNTLAQHVRLDGEGLNIQDLTSIAPHLNQDNSMQRVEPDLGDDSRDIIHDGCIGVVICLGDRLFNGGGERKGRRRRRERDLGPRSAVT